MKKRVITGVLCFMIAGMLIGCGDSEEGQKSAYQSREQISSEEEAPGTFVKEEEESTETDEEDSVFYKYVNKENEEESIQWYVDNFQATEAELRTWTEEQWEEALQAWLDKSMGREDDGLKIIGLSVVEGGNGYAEEYHTNAETIYDVLVEADVFTYNIIDRVYLNGELVEEDIKTVPVNDGDNIELETHWRD